MRKHIINKLQLIFASVLSGGLAISCINEKLMLEPEEPVINESNEAQWGDMQEGNYIVAFDLRWDNLFTRTDGDLANGDHNEHLVREGGIYACFFAENGELANIVDLRAYHWDTDDEGNNGEHEEPGLSEGRYYATYKVKRSNVKPASCLVLINAAADIINKFVNASTTYTINEVLSMVWEETADARYIGHAEADSYKYLTMTNASYRAGSGEIQCAVPIDVKKNFVAEEDLVQAGMNPYQPWDDTDFEEYILEIPVERMLAKFNFKIQPDGSNYDAANSIFTPDNNSIIVFEKVDDNGNIKYKTTEYSYKVKVLGWGINAMESQSYLFKNLNSKEYFAGWNDAGRRRSYWGEDPHYMVSDKYPFQYRNAIDKPDLRAYSVYEGSTDPDDRNPLINYSYSALNNPPTESVVLYAPENTYDNEGNYSKWINPEWTNPFTTSRLHTLVGTHLLLCTELVTNIPNPNFGKPGEPEFAKDIYRDREGVFYSCERDYFIAMVQTLNNYFSSQSEIQYKYYNWDGNSSSGLNDGDIVTVNTGREWVWGHLEWVRPANEAPYQVFVTDETYVADGEWYLYYKNSSGQDVRITNENAGDVYDELTKSDAASGGVTDAKKLSIEANVKEGDGQRMLWYDGLSIRNISNTQTLQRCEVGIMKDNGEPVLVNERGKTIKRNLGPLDDNHRKSLIYEWLGAVDHFNQGAMYYAAPIENVKFSGDNKNYGVIRNSWYQFSLGNINGLGTSVDNLNDPIVPNKIDHKDRINFNIEIINWHDISIDVPW